MVKDRKLVTAVTKQIIGGSASNHSFFALKVQKSAEHYTEAAMDEVELLDCVAQERKKCEGMLVSQGPMSRDTDGIRAIDNVDQSRYVATLHDSFFHNGPNGRHMCMVFGMLGCNLLSVIKAFNYRGIPIPAVKRMIKGVCKGLDFLHRRCHIIHTDLKPENILLQFPDQICPSSLFEAHGYEDDNSGDQHVEDDDHTAGTGAHTVSEPGSGVTIEELEAELRDPKLSSEERKRLKKRLKKKRQKERRKQVNVSDLDRVLANEDEINDDDSDGNFDAQSMLSDVDMESYFTKSYNTDVATKSLSLNGASRSTHPMVDDNKFVSRNFTSSNVTSEQIVGIMNDTVVLTSAGRAEVEAHLGACGSLMRQQHRVDGVAEVAFAMRAHGTESELAEQMSKTLDGIGWVAKEDGSGTRLW